MGIDLTPEEIVERLLDGVVARVRTRCRGGPGARDLLERLKDAGVPCALVTMSLRAVRGADPRPCLPGIVRGVVTGDAVDPRQARPGAVPHGGRRLLAVAPEECVAIEDSNTGATLGGRGRLHGPRRAAPRPGAAGGATRLPSSRSSGSRPRACRTSPDRTGPAQGSSISRPSAVRRSIVPRRVSSRFDALRRGLGVPILEVDT